MYCQFQILKGESYRKDPILSEIKTNIIKVRERIAQAAKRSGRAPESIELVAVSKTVPTEKIIEAIDAGITDIGENRVQ